MKKYCECGCGMCCGEEKVELIPNTIDTSVDGKITYNYVLHGVNVLKAGVVGAHKRSDDDVDPALLAALKTNVRNSKIFQRIAIEAIENNAAMNMTIVQTFSDAAILSIRVDNNKPFAEGSVAKDLKESVAKYRKLAGF